MKTTAYTLTRISPKLWREVRVAAASKGLTIREWLLQAIAARL